MNKKEIFDEYVKNNEIPDIVLKKININSFLTKNFAYQALRIGNSIGDLLDISIELIILDEIAKKFDLLFDSTEHAELHSKDISEKDLDNLIKGAILFENLKNNKKRYKEILKMMSDHIRASMKKVIDS